jgi:hypothetical protein
VIPTAVVGACRSTLSLRREVPRNGQMQGVRQAAPFKAAVHLLP